MEAYGADVKAGLARCIRMQDFYLRLVGMELSDEISKSWTVLWPPATAGKLSMLPTP